MVGRFDLIIEASVQWEVTDITCACTPGGLAIKALKFHWDGDMLVKDWLGSNNPDRPIANFLFFLFPAKRVTRTRFSVSGAGACCPYTP